MTLLLSFIIIIVSIIQSGLYVKDAESLNDHVKNIFTRYLMTLVVMLSFVLIGVGVLTRDVALICFSTITLSSSSFCLVKTTTNRYFFMNINLICALFIVIESIIQFRF